MLPGRKGSIHLFRFGGIDVFLHWSWFLIAVLQIGTRPLAATLTWSIFEYLSLFVIVLMHEFGHALACRSVGGRANQIVLWPLGGVAFVDPPPRAGALLWSIAAGPLVNVILVPVLTVARVLGAHSSIEVCDYLSTIWYINLGLLLFNLVPIYPLDGGQILRALLWFVFGRARSLLIASGIGLAASGIAFAAILYFVIAKGFYPWLLLITGFALVQSWSGLRQARFLAKIAAAPPCTGLACPNCHTPPPVGDFWLCPQCRRPYDIFATRGLCPNCGQVQNRVRCFECGAILQFQAAPPPVSPPVDSGGGTR